MPGGNDPINWWDFKLTAIDRMPTIIFAFVRGGCFALSSAVRFCSPYLDGSGAS